MLTCNNEIVLFSGSLDCERRQNPAGVFRHVNSVPVVLREASWCCPSAGWPREGEGTPEDILARLADGKHRFEEDESKLISHGKFFVTALIGDLKQNIFRDQMTHPLFF